MKAYDVLLQRGVPQSLALQLDYYFASDNTDGIDAFTAIGTDNVDVTEAIILQGEQNLNDQNAPLEDRYFIMSPATRSSIIQINTLRNQLFANSIGNLAGDKGQGYLGRVFTLDCYMSNNLEAGTSGKKNCIMQREAIAIATQQSVKIEKGLNIADGLFNEYVGYLCYGGLIVKSTFGREVDGK